jgi:hypothetical protein
MSKFFQNSDDGSDKLIKEQKKQAEKAEKEEKARQERLRAGREMIQAMFSEGGGYYSTAGGYEDVPVYSTRTVYDTADGGKSNSRSLLNDMLNADDPRLHAEGVKTIGADFGGATPSTETYQSGTKEEWKEGDAEYVEGIGSGFYDDFNQSILDYYMPEVESQFEDATSQNLFDLGRRGTLRSSLAADRAGELTEERALADAQVRTNAENQTAGLRKQISDAEQNAIAMLQATEDPTSAANSALTEVNAIQSQAPDFSPLGDLFTASALGYQRYVDAQRAQRYADSIPSSSPYQSSGRNVG